MGSARVILSALHYLIVIWIYFKPAAVAVNRANFRTCKDTGFCRKHRLPQDNALKPEAVQFSLDLSTVRVDQKNNLVLSQVTSSSMPSPLTLEISTLSDGAMRIRFVEDIARWQPADILMPSGLVRRPSIVLTNLSKLPSAVLNLAENSFFAVSTADTENLDDKSTVLVVHVNPLKFELYKGENLMTVVNERSLMYYEMKGASFHTADTVNDDGIPADRHKGKVVADYGEDGLAIYEDGTKEETSNVDSLTPTASPTNSYAETFGSHTDTMPNGPVSVGIDISFPFSRHVYGLPEHTSPLALPSTILGSAEIAPRYSEPYRLYNLDVFEYELDETMALYGHIPFLMAHGIIGDKGVSAGVFWFNPSETFVDICDGGSPTMPYKQSHWMSESGAVDIFLFSGSNPKQIFEALTAITGRQQLPPIFALGYHQCRWNYRDERDVAQVEAGFEDLDYPMDVIWLDIEHTDGKRYFTWDKAVFPNPVEMQHNVSSHGRRMVTIIDPHIKVDANYHIHKEATNLGLYIKQPDGVTDYKGWCWPGESSYLDFTDERVRQYWADQFSLNKYKGSTLDLFTWNDMNEPSVFNGPEVSMRKDMKNLAGVEHREWHNLYGLYMQRATAEGQVQRAPTSGPKPRPFVLSRAFFAGSQRYGAIWTGDNSAQWGHLEVAAPMLLSISIAGLSFAGADVGGFFGNPDSELFTRWNQAGAFTPFYRGHAHHDTKRREPWTFGSPFTEIARSVSMLRYSLLPYWYTTFYVAYKLGHPVMRPLFSEFPDDPLVFDMDDQWLIGDSLLVKPVTKSAALTADVYFPGKDPWYDLLSMKRYIPSILQEGSTRRQTVPAPLEHIPVFVRGGRIIPRKMRLRRSSKLMFYDPYTLLVALDLQSEAHGLLYMDDETTLDHEASPTSHALRLISFKKNCLHNNASILDLNQGTNGASLAAVSVSDLATGYEAVNTVERVVIVGLTRAPSSVVLKVFGKDPTTLSFSYDAMLKMLVVKKPDAKLTESWTIALI